jgi:cyclophilin family peptidyl-prolyl cis-trans isomerase/HEAT repeat protein
LSLGIRLVVFSVLLAAAGCVSVPIVSPVITWEEKLDWIVQLEYRRLIRDPNPLDSVVLVPPPSAVSASVVLPNSSDLIQFLADDEARVRRRAALALGRVGHRDAVEPLVLLLDDPRFQVRQMAAFSLGLIGDDSARNGLLEALEDVEPIVQGRAAEALGAIGVAEDAELVSAMVRRHIDAGALNGVTADELGYPLSPRAEAVRLGVFALGRLHSYEPLARAVLDEDGNPVSRWWPLAYAFSVISDERAAPVLLVLLESEGRFTPSFAARGIGALESDIARPWLERIMEDLNRPTAVIVQTIRALVAFGGESVPSLLTKIATDPGVEPRVRLEAITGLATHADPDAADLLLDLLANEAPAVRAAALTALARLDTRLFLGAMSGLDPDRDWTVQAALATALGTLPLEQAKPRLTEMLDKEDVRVLPSVLKALVKIGASDIDRILETHLAAEDMGVRVAAIEALVELGNPSAVPALLGALDASVADATYLVHAAILGALNELDSVIARPRLQEALTDRRWPLRLRAAELLRAHGEAVSASTTDLSEWTGSALGVGNRAALLSPRFSPLVYLETERGNIEIELAILDAPSTVANFMMLAREGFFNGLPFHRVVPDFFVQSGDPRGDGFGGSLLTIRDEINQQPYLRGTVGMALDGADTGGSQFFITLSPQPHLDGRYTVFGTVVSGMDVVDRLQQEDRLISVRIWDGVTPPE